MTYTLSMDGILTDYDLIIDGVNEESVDNPETVVRSNRGHCSSQLVEVITFFGVPTDQLDLRVTVAPL